MDAVQIQHAVFLALDNMVENGYSIQSLNEQAIDLQMCDADLEDVEIDVLIEYVNQWMTTSSK
jgi:hypothetical protein